MIASMEVYVRDIQEHILFSFALVKPLGVKICEESRIQLFLTFETT